MFDQLITQLQKKTTSKEPPGRRPLPNQWRLDNREAFIYRQGTKALSKRLAKGLAIPESRGYVTVVRDVHTGLIAVFDLQKHAMEHFNFYCNVNVTSRARVGYCIISQTQWTKYGGGPLCFEPVAQDERARGHSYVLIAYDPISQERTLYNGYKDAEKALKVHSTVIRNCVEQRKASLANGVVVEIATLADILTYFPKWTPSSYRFIVCLDKTPEDPANPQVPPGAFSGALRVPKSTPVVKAWNKFLASQTH